jgi:transcriptional regulator with XRE-family HTH domain
MGTIERGESNLSFQNIAKVATTLKVSLSALFLELEKQAERLGTASAGQPGPKGGKHPGSSKRG